jgi:hypothetical protein
MKSKKQNLLKCVEELSELTTRLLQYINKGKIYKKKILLEIEDVEKQITIIKYTMK